jgi:hypothetical protein
MLDEEEWVAIEGLVAALKVRLNFCFMISYLFNVYLILTSDSQRRYYVFLIQLAEHCTSYLRHGCH